MKIDKYTYWKLNDVEDYDNFIKQASKKGCKWLAGQVLEDATMRSGVIHLGFPFVVEVDNENKTVSLVPAGKEKQADDFKKYYNSIVSTISTEIIVPVEEEKENSNLNLTVLSYQDENGHTLSFTEEGVRANLDNLLETIRKRFSSLVVGDRVVVVDEGLVYNLYKDWFRENNIPLDYAVRYAYGRRINSGVKGTIRYMAPHSKNSKEMLCLVETDYNWSEQPVYLVGLNGLVKEK